MQRVDSPSSMDTVVGPTQATTLRKRAFNSLKLSLPKAVLRFFDPGHESLGENSPESQLAPTFRQHRGSHPTTPLRTAKSFFGSVSSTRGSSIPSNTSTTPSFRTRRHRNSISSTSRSLRDRFRRSPSHVDSAELRLHSSPITIPDVVRYSNPLQRSVPSNLTEGSDNPLRQRMLNSPGFDKITTAEPSGHSSLSPRSQNVDTMPGTTFQIEDIDERSVPFEEAFEKLSLAQHVSTTDAKSTKYRRPVGSPKPYGSLMHTQDPFVDPPKPEVKPRKSCLKLSRSRSETYDSGYASILESQQNCCASNMDTLELAKEGEANSKPVASALLTPSKSHEVSCESGEKQTFSNGSSARQGIEIAKDVTYIETENSADRIDNNTFKEVAPPVSAPTGYTNVGEIVLPLRMDRDNYEASVDNVQTTPPADDVSVRIEDDGTQTDQPDHAIASVRHVYGGTFFGSRTERPLRTRHTFANLLRVPSREHHAPYSARSMANAHSAHLIHHSRGTSTNTSDSGNDAPYHFFVFRPRSSSGSSWLSSTTVEIDAAVDNGYEDGGPLERIWRVPSPQPASVDSTANGSLD